MNRLHPQQTLSLRMLSKHVLEMLRGRTLAACNVEHNGAIVVDVGGHVQGRHDARLSSPPTPNNRDNHALP